MGDPVSQKNRNLMTKDKVVFILTLVLQLQLKEFLNYCTLCLSAFSWKKCIYFEQIAFSRSTKVQYFMLFTFNIFFYGHLNMNTAFIVPFPGLKPNSLSCSSTRSLSNTLCTNILTLLCQINVQVTWLDKLFL